MNNFLYPKGKPTRIHFNWNRFISIEINIFLYPKGKPSGIHFNWNRFISIEINNFLYPKGKPSGIHFNWNRFISIEIKNSLSPKGKSSWIHFNWNRFISIEMVLKENRSWYLGWLGILRMGPAWGPLSVLEESEHSFQLKWIYFNWNKILDILVENQYKLISIETGSFQLKWILFETYPKTLSSCW